MEGRLYANVAVGPRFKTLPGAALDGTASTFQFLNEDHTLGNALRYIIMKNPRVEFCGYSIPHPSEPYMNLRIQTFAAGDVDHPEVELGDDEAPYTALQALEKGLDDLLDLTEVIKQRFIDEAERIEGAREEEEDDGAGADAMEQ